MGNSQSHSQTAAGRPPPLGTSPNSPEEAVVTTPSQMDVDDAPPSQATAASASLPQNRRRSRAPSSPRLSTSMSLGSTLGRLPSFSNLRSGQGAGPSSSPDGPSHQHEGRPKDKKRRRISQMLGIGSRQTSSLTESGADGDKAAETSSSSPPPVGLGLTDSAHGSTPESSRTPAVEHSEVDMVDASIVESSRVPPSTMSPSEVPLPPSRPASVPPPSSTSDVLFPSQLPPLPTPTTEEEDAFDPLWSPRLRAQSLISQLTQEIEQGDVVPSVAAYIGETPARSAPVVEPTAEQAHETISISPDRPAIATGIAAARPSLERPTLRGRLMSSLLGRSGPSTHTPSSSTSSLAGTADASSGPSSDSSTPPLSRQPSERGPMPTGTSLIVQGLVQTSAPPRPSSQASPSTPSTGSSSSTPSTPSFDEQAVLLGGLLSVATAATASSLLSPPPGSADAAVLPPRAAGSTIDSIRQRIARIRSRNAGTTPASAQGGIEEILRNYMSSSLGGAGGASPTTATISLASGAAASAEPAVPPEEGSFEAFLADLQTDLVRALREFNGLPPVEETGSVPTPSTDAADASPPTSSTESTDAEAEPNSSGTPDTPGVTAEGQARAAAVGGGGHGLGVEPRRLNWTRVYRFPARDVQGTLAADGRPSTDSGDEATTLAPSDGASTSESTASADPANATAADPSAAAPRARPNTVTPMIMVGVRSIARLDAAEAFGAASPRPPTLRPRRASAPSTPEPSSTAPSTSPTTEPPNPLDSDGDAPMSDGSPTSVDPASVTTPGQRLRHAIRAMRGRRAGSTDGSQTGAGGAGTRSFVLWVVGGLYSSDHPILAAPGLFGGQLDHDDLWALAELMGQVKPPTATSADIANSGLEIIKGAMVKTYCEEGKVLENSSARCMVCLEDYEDEEDCRILGCKHVFHQACIDKWLSTGRNACPACRTKGVKPTEGPSDAAPSAAASTTIAPDVPSSTSAV